MGNARKLCIIVILSMILTSCAGATDNKSRIIKLEQEIAKLEQEIKELEGVKEATLDSAPSVAPVEEQTKSTTAESSNTENISMKQVITIPDIIEFSLHSAKWMDRINPSDTSSVYSYMEDQVGETYLVIKGDVTNLSEDTLDPEDYQESLLRINDKYNFQINWDVEDQDGTGFYGRVKPLQKGKLVLYASVTDEVRSQMQSGTITLSILNDPNRLGYYFYPEQDGHRNFRLNVKPQP